MSGEKKEYKVPGGGVQTLITSGPLWGPPAFLIAAPNATQLPAPGMVSRGLLGLEHLPSLSPWRTPIRTPVSVAVSSESPSQISPRRGDLSLGSGARCPSPVQSPKTAVLTAPKL